MKAKSQNITIPKTPKTFEDPFNSNITTKSNELLTKCVIFVSRAHSSFENIE